MWGTPLGVPPQGYPGVREVWKPLGLLGVSLGGQNLQGRVGGFFFGNKSVGFFPNVLYRSIKEVLDGFLMIF